MRWLSIDLYHRRCSGSIELLVDGANQHDNHVGAGYQQYFIECGCCLCEWFVVGTRSEQLRPKRSAHTGLEQEPSNAFCYGRPNHQPVWRWSVYLFGNCG